MLRRHAAAPRRSVVPSRSQRSVNISRPLRPSVQRRFNSTIAAERASLPNDAAGWAAYVGKRLSEATDENQRKGLQQFKTFIEQNPEFIEERSEELKKFAVPAWDDSPIDPNVVRKRIHANATKFEAKTPLYQLLKIQDEIGLRQTVAFSNPSPASLAHIKELEESRNALVEKLLKDPSVSAEDRAEIEKFNHRIAKAGMSRDFALTSAERVELDKQSQIAKEAEAELLSTILKTDEDKAAYQLQMEAKQKEYSRYEKDTLLGRLLYGK